MERQQWGRHGDPVSASNDDTISHASGNMISHHSYLTNNVISSHSGPENNASTAVNPKTVYVGKNWYPISIIQLAEVSDIAWMKKSGFDILTSSVGPLSDRNSVSDFIIITDNKIPTDTYYALQDAEKNKDESNE